MSNNTKATRGMPRSLFYAMIPIGFILLVLFLILSGFWTQETTDESPTVVEQESTPVN